MNQLLLDCEDLKTAAAYKIYWQ